MFTSQDSLPKQIYSDKLFFRYHNFEKIVPTSSNVIGQKSTNQKTENNYCSF